MFEGIYWYPVKDGDPRLFALYKRHYSYYHYADGRRSNPSNPNRNLIAGPGEKLCLLTSDCKAGFIWRKFIDKSGQTGINNAFFRNEGAYNGEVLSSTLILAAEKIAAFRWPGERLYTYINTTAVQGDGYCYKIAGWSKVGRTKSRNLLILAKESAKSIEETNAIL